MKVLNVAEKNAAAKIIATHLNQGRVSWRDGENLYNKIYEFNAHVLGCYCQMKMTSVRGHLFEYELPIEYKKWNIHTTLDIFDATVQNRCIDNSDNDKIRRTLQKEVRGCDTLIIWTDCDREGENIGFQIIEVCTDINKDLKIYRARFSDLTSVSVLGALTSLEQPNRCYSDAVNVRRELDLKIGAAFTILQTLTLQGRCPRSLYDKSITFGTCQFPTLGFVVERYTAVKDFVADTYWTITVNHTENGLSVDFTWERVRLADQEWCRALYEAVVEHPLATVRAVDTQHRTRLRPLPLNTVALEKLACRKLGFTAKETLTLAEDLYMKGLISYPRTETDAYSAAYTDTTGLVDLVRLQTQDPHWGTFARRLVARGPTPRKGPNSDNSHPPIYPTSYKKGLKGSEELLYELIARSFLACCSSDAEGLETTVSIEVGGENFSASGLQILARNYLEVYPYEDWSPKEIHIYQAGATFETRVGMVEETTAPPELLTEADLIELMATHGIGTDATHATHIETIKERKFVTIERLQFVPTALGLALVDGYDAMGLHLAQPGRRAQLEADLRAICEGERQAPDVLAEQITLYKSIFRQAKDRAGMLERALERRLRQQE